MMTSKLCKLCGAVVRGVELSFTVRAGDFVGVSGGASDTAIFSGCLRCSISMVPVG